MPSRLPLFALLPLAALASLPAAAQTKEQDARTLALLQSADKAIDAALHGDEKLRATLQAELKQIEATKDAKARTAAIAAYQARNAPAYRALLAKAGVNLDALAKSLTGIAPDRKWTVVNGTHIVGHAVTEAPSTPAPTLPPKTTKTLSAGDYVFSRDPRCGLGAGGSVERSGTKVTSSAIAVELGGCTNTGTMRYDFAVAQGQRATVSFKGDMRADLFVIAAGGGSQADADISIASGGVVIATRCSVLAPLVWSASDGCGYDNNRATFTTDTVGSYSLVSSISTHVLAVTLAGGASSSGTVHIDSATITIEPR